MANPKNDDAKEAIVTEQARLSDLHRSGRVNTQVETKTVVEDRTEEPASHMVKRYKSEDITLDGGTILTSYTDEVEDA